MGSPYRSWWRPSRSKLAIALAAVCLVSISWLLVSTCSDVSEHPPRVAQETRELGASRKDVAPEDKSELESVELDSRSKQALRALGYLEGATETRAGQGPRPPKQAGAKTPHTAALSALDYQTAQSLNQRANEAFGYLGERSFETPAEFDTSKSRPALRLESTLRATPDAPGDRLEEHHRFRDEAAAHSLRQNKVADGLVRGGELAERKRAGRRSLVSDLDTEMQTLSPAQRFARDRRSRENFTFQSASGYWANTYVPGDPVMRWLESRLEKRDRAALEAFSSRPLLLEAAAHQTPQPFDPPSSAAISVFVQADRRGLAREGRMLVQVGLQGTRRHGGLRPAMNVGIVLDLRGTIGAEAASAMRALMDGFLKAKDVGDRFSLTVAGKPGGVLVGADAFRHGPIAVAMSRLLEPAGPGTAGEPLFALDEAVRKTAASLRRNDDPAGPLGSSLVLLVTSQRLGPLTGALTAIAHESAVAGVPVSVVGIGDQLQLDELERVTLAGQGNRRLMHAPADAERLVERELSSLARVIARALRLRIRLAPDVKLVEVVGTERLDAAGAQQVRQAEKSIDRRLARNLGIDSDRGEDEEGIQIVIPTFYSGDAHAVLLDVVAAGPGPIADVTVRYKDLVYLRNSVARANLTLGRSAEPAGPLERNVVKNYLAIRLSGVLKQAGRTLLAGGDAQTIALVGDFQALLQSLQREVPGFRNDADLANDAELLGEYLALLEAGVLQQDQPRLYLANSLQLSGFFKTVPRSPADPWNRRR